MVEWLAGNRIRGTSTERTTGAGFNPISAISGGWKELARTTLGSASHPITVSSLPDKRYYMVLAHNIAGGSINWNFRVGTGGTLDTGSNYADRHSQNGAGDSTTAPANRWGDFLGNQSKDRFTQLYISNLSGKEKLMTGHVADRGTSTGAGSAPERVEVVGKWTNTSLIDILSLQDDNSQNFGSGSEMVVLGWDEDDTHTDNFWEQLASVNLSGGSANLIDSGTFTAKKYLWIQLYVSTTGGAVSQRLAFNGDTGSNYAQSFSSDGASDNTATGGVNIDAFNDDMVTNSGGFSNFFIINNSANEKLGIVKTISQEAAGSGTAPTRDEGVLKWANVLSQITRLTFTNNKAGDMDTTTTLKVWGSN